MAQEAFFKVAECINQFDDERPFAPWFFRIVVNDALELARKQMRNVSLDEQLDEPTAQLAKRLADPDLQPEQWMERKETHQTILKAISSLPPSLIAQSDPDSTVPTAESPAPLISVTEAEARVGFDIAELPFVPDGFDYLGARLYDSAVNAEYRAPGYGTHLIIRQPQEGFDQSDLDKSCQAQIMTG